MFYRRGAETQRGIEELLATDGHGSEVISNLVLSVSIRVHLWLVLFAFSSLRLGVSAVRSILVVADEPG
jgi:hypothetical protein